MATTRNAIAWWVILLAIMLFATNAQSGLVQKSAIEGAGNDLVNQHPENWISTQVGAFSRMDLADKMILQLREKGYDPYYRYEDTGSKGMWYRVYVGRHRSRQAAGEMAEAMVQQGIITSYLLRRVVGENDAQAAIDFPEAEQSPAVSAQEGKPQAVPMVLAAGTDSHGAARQAPDASVVRLSLQDAIRYSLEGNREISVVSYDPKQAQAQLEGAESVYDMLLFADTTFSREPNLESSVTDIVTEDERRARLGIRKPLKTGGSISTYLESKYADLNNSGVQRTYKNTLAPTVELQQPILNNIGSKKEQAAIKIANHQARLSEAEFLRKVIEVTNKVSAVYWKLYRYREFMEINRKNLDMAEEVHRREAERHARGISQQLDVARAKSNAQTRRSTWIRSREEYLLTMDRLKLLLNWQRVKIDSDVQVIPVEQPRMTPMEVDEAKTIEMALNHRPEIKKAQQALMIREADQELAAHQRLPTLDAFGRYSISGYGDEFSDAWDDVSMDDDDAWEVGLQFEWAFGNRLAKSRYHKKSLSRSQAKARLKRVEDEIKLEVKQVLTRLASVKGEITANRLAMESAGKVVDGEFTRFDIGQTTNEELLRAQDLLAVTSRSFVRAVADYNTTIQDLYRAQGILPADIMIEDINR